MAWMNAPTERHAAAVAAPGGTERVLVVGPGPGIGLAAVARRAGLVIGVDPSEEMLAACRRRCADAVAAGTVLLRRGDAESNPLDDASVDVVLSVNNLPLWADRRAALAESFRVSRPGARLVLSAHEKWLPVSGDTLAAELEAAGFRDTRMWTWDPPRAPRAAQFAARVPGASGE